MISTKLTPLAVLLAGLTATAQAEVFMSEYIEGSSNNKAIELYNPGETAVLLGTYQLEYYFNGNTDVGRTIVLEGEIPAKGTYVIAHGSAAADVLAKANLVSSGSWFNGDDAIVLRNGDNIIDSFGQIGVDPGYKWQDAGVATQDMTLRRLASVTEGRSDAHGEFVPSEQWQAFAKNDFSDLGQFTATTDNGDEQADVLTCGAEKTTINAIQGEGDASPLAGQVVTVEGIVTADFQGSSELKGFFLQELNGDGNPQTSEGIFVYHSKDDVNVGDLVRLKATVAEYYGATQLGYVSDLITCGTDTVSATQITLPTDNLEAYEGMLVTVPQQLFVADNYGLGRYGEVSLATERLYQGTQIALPGSDANAVEAANRRKQILLDDGSTAQNLDPIAYPAPGLDAYNSLRLGDTVNNLTGVLTYGYSKYRIHPTATPEFTASNPRTEAPMIEEHGDLRIASFNVLNYFNGDGQGAGFPTARGADTVEEFQRQKAKIVAAITALDADIIGLLEIENDGFGEFSAIADLVAALNAHIADANYAFVNFGVEQVGTDKITSALIYDRNKVKEVGTPALTTAQPFDYGNRPPIAQSFRSNETLETVTVAMAHLRSKGSCTKATDGDADNGDGQGCWNATRVYAANQYAAWLQANPTGVADSDMIILGDFNAYAMEDPIRTFADIGFANVSLAKDGNALDYSYAYQGRIGSLDHALASESLLAKVTDVAHWHINADEPTILDYNMEYKSQNQQASLYAESPYRASDHDPVVLELNTQPLEVLSEEVDGLSGKFNWHNEVFKLPQGFDFLEVTLAGGWGNADLYLGYQKAPTLKRFDCRSANAGNEEVCLIEKPAAGNWKIRVTGPEAYGDVKLSYRAVKLQK